MGFSGFASSIPGEIANFRNGVEVQVFRAFHHDWSVKVTDEIMIAIGRMRNKNRLVAFLRFRIGTYDFLCLAVGSQQADQKTSEDYGWNID